MMMEVGNVGYFCHLALNSCDVVTLSDAHVLRISI